MTDVSDAELLIPLTPREIWQCFARGYHGLFELIKGVRPVLHGEYFNAIGLLLPVVDEQRSVRCLIKDAKMATLFKSGKLAARSVDACRYKFIQRVVAALLNNERAGGTRDSVGIITRASNQEVEAEAVFAATCQQIFPLPSVENLEWLFWVSGQVVRVDCSFDLLERTDALIIV